MATETDFIKTYIAGEAFGSYRRVKYSTGGRTYVYSDAGEGFVGVTREAVSSGDPFAARLWANWGTFKMTAAGAVTIGAVVYGAADGKVDDTAAGQAIGRALDTALADGDIIEVQPIQAEQVGFTEILDVNDAELIIFTATGSAVNELAIANAATGNNPSITASGETNVGIDITAKGTGDLNLTAGTGDVVIKCGTVAADKISLQVYDGDNTAYVEAITLASHATVAQITIAAAVTDAIGFYGTTPAAQPAHIADPAAAAAVTFTHSWNSATDPTAAEGAALIADLGALKTAIDANKAAIDATNAMLATLGLTAAA